MFSELLVVAIAHLLTPERTKGGEPGVSLTRLQFFFGDPKVMHPRHPSLALPGPDDERGAMRGQQQDSISPNDRQGRRPQEFLAQPATWLPNRLQYAVVIRPMH
jgi:hypothetical protein